MPNEENEKKIHILTTVTIAIGTLNQGDQAVSQNLVDNINAYNTENSAEPITLPYFREVYDNEKQQGALSGIQPGLLAHFDTILSNVESRSASAQRQGVEAESDEERSPQLQLPQYARAGGWAEEERKSPESSPGTPPPSMPSLRRR